MHKRTFFRVSVSVFLVMGAILFVTPVPASPLTILVPGDYPTIQAAINAANPGDTIEVASGIYYEHVIVNVSLTLVGNGSSTTFIHGNGTGTVVQVIAHDVEIVGFTIQNGGQDLGNSGLEIYGSNTVVFGNVIMNNFGWGGILVGAESNSNVIRDNMIANNSWGVYIPCDCSILNMFYHNNFIDNSLHVQSSTTATWDNGAEGNYWDDYTGVDDYSGPSQNETGSDGIGDTPYPLWFYGQDRYPLMTPWIPFVKVFNIAWDSVNYQVATRSNSTITHFIFTQTLAQISFNVSGSPSTLGYCNVTIPKNLLSDNPWTITLDDVPKTDFTQSSNGSHTFLYFNYTHSGTNHIVISGTWVVPEFSWTHASILFIALAVLLVFIRRRSRLFK